MSAPLPLTPKLILMPHMRASWANGNYMQTYFGITPVQAAASIFPAFTAGSGVKDVRGGAALIWRFSSHWFVVCRRQRQSGAAEQRQPKFPISISDTTMSRC